MDVKNGLVIMIIDEVNIDRGEMQGKSGKVFSRAQFNDPTLGGTRMSAGFWKPREEGKLQRTQVSVEAQTHIMEPIKNSLNKFAVLHQDHKKIRLKVLVV